MTDSAEGFLAGKTSISRRNVNLSKYVSEQSPQIHLKNYIVEPDIAKDRGPDEGLASAPRNIHPDEPFFLIQADLLREPDEAFLK